MAKRPSNIIIRVFVGILLLFGVFMIGVLINHFSKQVGDSDTEFVAPE